MMSATQYLLKSDVVIEPLISRWYAWSHMISPATACLSLAYRYLPLMESFVSSPDIHEAACKNPALRGGPFVDLPPARVDEVQALLESTKQQVQMIQFGEGLRQSLRLLMKNADGFSIEQYYSQLPESVKGYVELVYTLSGAPDIRVIEPLLYKKKYQRPDMQSAMMYRVKGNDRPFAFSTPRLKTTGALEINKPFESNLYDFLAQLRTHPQPFEAIANALSVTDAELELLRSFLTEAEVDARPSVKTPLGKTRWRYFGHACVLVESPSGANVLVDPLIAYEGDDALPRFTLADLPERIDFVVLTHNHADHVLIETLLAIRHKVDTVVVPASGGSLVDPSLKLMLESIGFKKVIALEVFEQLAHHDLTLIALPFIGEHGDLDIKSKVAWLMKAGEDTMLFAADSNNLEPKMYDLIKEIYGEVTTLFLGMECLGAPFSWVYGAYMPLAVDRKKDQSRRLNGSDFERGLKVIESLGCKNVYVYAMGAEPWLQFVTSIDPAEDTVPAINAKKLIDHCHSIGITAQRLFGSADTTID
jgi:L-ascorbate metabolism protein UlaG (beta-lactamase superfamily)